MSQTPAEDSTVNQLEAAKLLLDEWKFRHQHCWDSLQRYGLAAVTVSIVPYIKIDLFAQLGKVVLIFAVVGWLLFLAAVWLFAAEYYRMRPVSERHRELLKPYYPDRPHYSDWREILERKIGWTTINILFWGATIFSLANGILLWVLEGRLGSGTPAK